MNRRGVTFPELLMIATMFGCVVALSGPKRADLKRRAVAAQVVADVDAVKKATVRFYADSGYFPRETPGGTIPQNLDRYLPQGFAFTKNGWTLDYDRWSRKSPSVHIKTPTQIGVSVTIVDAKVGVAAMAAYGNQSKFSFGNKYTFMIVGL